MDTPWVSCTCPLNVCIPRDPVCNLWLTYLTVPLCVPAPFLCVYLCLSFPLSCMYTCSPLSLWIPVCTYPPPFLWVYMSPRLPHPPKTLCVLSHSLSLYAQDPVCNQRRANAMVLEPDRFPPQHSDYCRLNRFTSNM